MAANYTRALFAYAALWSWNVKSCLLFLFLSRPYQLKFVCLAHRPRLPLINSRCLCVCVITFFGYSAQSVGTKRPTPAALLSVCVSVDAKRPSNEWRLPLTVLFGHCYVCRMCPSKSKLKPQRRLQCKLRTINTLADKRRFEQRQRLQRQD